jgi:4-hydroxy-tetrahydrodipicolinate reductase
MIRIGLSGAAGRMGREVARLCQGNPEFRLVGGIETPGHEQLGMACGTGTIADNPVSLLTQCDVLVDFSVPAVTATLAGACAAAGRPLVSGVTGLSGEQATALRSAAQRVPVVHAPNFSVGVTLLTRLVGLAARMLGPAYDVEIVETHHRRKADAPSGTARLLAEAVRAERRETVLRHGREGAVGPKPAGEVGISSIRTGDVVGEHSVLFGGPGERLELAHKAESRSAFAAGALAAARFVSGREPGLYTMAQVLGLE